MTLLEESKSLFEQKKFNKAIKKLNIILENEVNNADAFYTRAICYRKIGEFDKSINDLTSIIERLPEEPTLFCERGISYFHNKDIDAALLDMDKAVELDPENPFRYSSRAYIKANVDKSGAIDDYKRAIELDPEDDISYNNLGLLQENMGKGKQSRTNFNKANQLINYNPEERKNPTISNNSSYQKEDSVRKIMLRLFTSRETQKEYFKFLKSFFKK